MRLSIVFLLFFACSQAVAQIYQYSDENGTIHFTNTAPPSNSKNVTISTETFEDPVARQYRLEQKAMVEATVSKNRKSKNKRRHFNEEEEDSRPNNIINTQTGEVLNRAAGGYVEPRDGTFHTDAAGGIINTRTGEFSPTN